MLVLLKSATGMALEERTTLSPQLTLKKTLNDARTNQNINKTI